MKVLIIIDGEEAKETKVFDVDWDYIAKIQDEDFTEITEAIEKVTDKTKNHNA